MGKEDDDPYPKHKNEQRDDESWEEYVARRQAEREAECAEWERMWRENPPLPLSADLPLRPELRIRDDAPSLAVDEATSAEAALHRLDDEPNGVVLRGEAGEAKAIVLTPERYAELAGYEVQSDGGSHFVATERGIVPQPSVLRALMIEQVDPTAEWNLAARIGRPGRLEG